MEKAIHTAAGKRAGANTGISGSTVNMAMAAVFLALCFILPFFTGQIPAIGSKISPMHIPVLICGYVCGWQWGLVVGFVAPVLRSMIFGMPPMMPTAVAMSFELAAYGAMTGWLYARLPKNHVSVYVSLIGAMLFGRIVWGLVSVVLYGVMGNAFTVQAFLAGAFINAVPAIILHIAIVPLIVIALRRAKVLK